MKIVAVGFGSPSTMLRHVEPEQRAPKETEVAINVKAAAVNPKDVKLYTDKEYATTRGRLVRFPLELGLEAAGTVTAVGGHPSGPLGPIRVGDEVIAYRIEGAYSSRIVVNASAVLPKPSHLTWEQAASVSLAGTTAVHCLAAVCARAGETVLVHASAGNVGRAVAQLGILAGLKIVGTAAEKDFPELRGLGVIPVRYGVGLIDRVRATAPRGIDAAIDTIGTDEAIDTSLSCVREKWRIATIANPQRAEVDGFQALGGDSGNDTGIRIRDNARFAITALAQAKAL